MQGEVVDEREGDAGRDHQARAGDEQISAIVLAADDPDPERQQCRADGWPEVGSRAMQRMLIADDAYAGGWITVQDGRYRFLAVAEGSLMVRGVISEYLAFEVIWE